MKKILTTVGIITITFGLLLAATITQFIVTNCIEKYYYNLFSGH
jgi:hypothetical protein